MDIQQRCSEALAPQAASHPPRTQNYVIPPPFDRIIREFNFDEHQLQSCCLNIYSICSVEGEDLFFRRQGGVAVRVIG